MTKLLIHLIISTIAVFVAAYFIPGIHLPAGTQGLVTALVVAVVLGVINIVIKPILVVLTLPVTIFTLGLFLLVINAAMVLLVAWLVPGFVVDGWLAAVLFSLVVSVINWFLSSLAK